MLSQCRLSFDVTGHITGPTIDYRLDFMYDEYPYETSWQRKSLTTGAVVAASGFDEVTELFAVALCRLGSKQ
jgi:hypothetical protein